MGGYSKLHDTHIRRVQRRMTMLGLAHLADSQPEQEGVLELVASRLGTRRLFVELLVEIRLHGIDFVLGGGRHDFNAGFPIVAAKRQISKSDCVLTTAQLSGKV